MLSTWALFLQIETASVRNNFGGSRLNHDTKGGGYMFWTNRNRVWWSQIDQTLRLEVGGHRRTHRMHESKTCPRRISR